MKPQKHEEPCPLFRQRLDSFINMSHSLVSLANAIDWESFDKLLGDHYSDGKGAPALPTRLMVGIHYLKYTFNVSDESVLERWLENAYWQYFCGYEYFQTELPMHPTSLVKWRNRHGDCATEAMLSETLETAKRSKLLKATDAEKIVVDTTVQEKAVAFPTDAGLYYKMREKLSDAAETRGIALRRNYRRVGKSLLVRQFLMRRCRKFGQAAKAVKRLKNQLKHVYQDIKKSPLSPDDELSDLLSKTERLLNQTKDSKNKLYSIHAPEVECIAKGKSHKKYEFGCKTSIVKTLNNHWIIGVSTFHGNPYDGDTLSESIETAERLSGCSIKDIYADRGYRGRKQTVPNQTMHITGDTPKRLLSKTEIKNRKKRNGIEPTNGHLKSDNRLSRNYLLGKTGDKINALLAGCGYNMRKLLRAFFFCFLNGFIVCLNGSRASIWL